MKAKFLVCVLLVFGLSSITVAAQEKSETNGAARVINGGVVNGKALSLAKPAYPAAARAVRAGGAVNVQVTIDESGGVISATAVSGHPLLRAAAVEAARQSKFSPTLLSGQPVKVTGVIVYNFSLPVNFRYVGAVLGESEAEITDRNELASIKNELGAQYAGESKMVDEILTNFSSDPQSQRLQSTAVNTVIGSLANKLAGSPEALWEFELGLAKGRISGKSADETVLRTYLPKFRDLSMTAPEGANSNLLDSLKALGEYADKPILTTADKTKINDLIRQL